MPTAFLPLQHNTKSNTNGIPSCCVTIPQLIAECAPERGNEPPAQGGALGNKDNITDSALTGQKRYHKEENAFAPSGAELLHGI